MGAFSVLYTINIAVSNLSLHLVTVPVSPDDILACNTITHMLTLMLFLRVFATVPSSRSSVDTIVHHPHIGLVLPWQV